MLQSHIPSRVWLSGLLYFSMSLSLFGMSSVPTPVAASDRALGKGVIPGPVPARVLRVIDGDTVVVRAAIWPGQYIDVSVRLANVDAPELRSHCKQVRDRAWRARNVLHSMIAGTTINLHDIRHGKYAGRVVARARTIDGEAISEGLIAAGVVVLYRDRRKARRKNAAECSTAAALTLKP